MKRLWDALYAVKQGILKRLPKRLSENETLVKVAFNFGWLASDRLTKMAFGVVM
ncbi:MAG: hypothetical protein GF419_00280, partial [Ignavibacteriales bacterium]|nr:hypothetical protein [Ignavibacteriales bacterium]